MKLHDILKNKVIFYLFSRYGTYGLQFLCSLLIASKLGPYYMGIWGFILLIMQYFQQLHFGIANSFNVFYVHNLNNIQEQNNYTANSLVLVGILALLAGSSFLIYGISDLSQDIKFPIHTYWEQIALIVMLQYFYQFLIALFRVKNKLLIVAFCQSVVVIFNFFSVLFCSGEVLIKFLIWGYLIGYTLSVVLAFSTNVFPPILSCKVNIIYQKNIIKKGLLLFLYNSCFFFIIISVRTMISWNYSIEEFGLFTFAFTLAHAFMLLLESLSFVIFPKVIAKLSSSDIQNVQQSIQMYRSCYIVSANILIYSALVLFPLFLLILPKFSAALSAIELIALTILMHSNSVGYTDLLIARNKEKISALTSLTALTVNCLFAYFFIKIWHVSFYNVIFATMISYFGFVLTVAYCGMQTFKRVSIFQTFGIVFPYRIVIPFSVAIFICVNNMNIYLPLPLLLYMLLNRKYIRNTYDVFLKMLNRPDVINL